MKVPRQPPLQADLWKEFGASQSLEGILRSIECDGRR